MSSSAENPTSEYAHLSDKELLRTIGNVCNANPKTEEELKKLLALVGEAEKRNQAKESKNQPPPFRLLLTSETVQAMINSRKYRW